MTLPTMPDHMPSAQGDQDAPGPDHQPVDEEGHHQEHQQDEPVPGEEPVSCEISMQERLPTPKVWASPGGSCPRTPSNLSSTNTVTLEETDKEYQDPDDLAHHGDHHAQEDVQGEQGEKEGEAWIQGAGDEENERYKSVLEYCEKRRIELRAKIEEDEERMKEARRKEDTWMLLRESITFLKSKEVIWRTRRLEECSRIREEEKRDRLAVVAVKKRKYGVKRMTKEENSRIKERTEERLEIATAKTNYWRNYRERKDDMEEEEIMAWRTVKEGIMNLEEGAGQWEEGGHIINTTKENHIHNNTPKLSITKNKPLILTEEHTAEDRRMEEGVRNVGEVSQVKPKPSNKTQKSKSKSTQHSSPTRKFKIQETNLKKQEEGVRKGQPSTKVRKRIQSLEEKLENKRGDGEKRKLEEEDQRGGKVDKEGGKADKYMGEKPGGGRGS